MCSTQVKFWPSFESVSSNLPNPQSPTTPRDLNQQWGQPLQGLKRLGNTGRTLVRFAVKIKRVASGGTEVSRVRFSARILYMSVPTCPSGSGVRLFENIELATQRKGNTNALSCNQIKIVPLKKREKKNGFNTTLFPGGPPPQY